MFKRLAIPLILVGGICFAFPLTQAGATPGKDHKITICHWANHKYVEIDIDVAGLNGHGDHPDIYPVPVDGCPVGGGESSEPPSSSASTSNPAPSTSVSETPTAPTSSAATSSSATTSAPATSESSSSAAPVRVIFSIPFEYPNCGKEDRQVYFPDYFPHVRYTDDGVDVTGKTINIKYGQSSGLVRVVIDDGYYAVFTDQMPQTYVFKNIDTAPCDVVLVPTSPVHHPVPVRKPALPTAATTVQAIAPVAAPVVVPVATGQLASTGTPSFAAIFLGLLFVGMGLLCIFGGKLIEKLQKNQ